jgi:ATP-binding cassette, subfamily B, bacterial PglK
MLEARTFAADFLAVLGDEKKRLPAIFALFLFAAFLDLCGLGMVLPLITAITVPDSSTLNMKMPFGENLRNLDLRLLAAGVVVIYVLRAITAYWVQRAIARFSEGQRGQLMTRLLDAYLRKPYEFHLERNSAVLINNTLNLTWGYSLGVLYASLRLATDLVTFTVVLGFLAWTNWQVVAVAIGALVIVLAAYNMTARGILTQSGEIVAISQASAVRVLNHALGAFREVRVLGIEEHAVAEMRYHAQRLAEAGGKSGAIQALPRYLIETSLIVLLAALALLVKAGSISSADLVPTLGLFAVAAIRLMPGTTAIVASLNSMRSNRYALRQLAEDLKVVEDGRLQHPALRQSTARLFRGFKTIEFAGVTYEYPASTRPALQDVNFNIQAGQAIGIIGRTGAGKSTLADALLGLVSPQAGRILVDGKDIQQDIRAWMNELAYIPQAVFVKDDTLRANIAFGVPPSQINEQRLNSAIVASRLEEVVAGLPDGLETLLGERGVRLSGGQRQRVALARALYHDRQLIVMDEATAALDNVTEQEVIRAIQTLHGRKTLIIIAHRHSTLEGCDAILTLSGGRLKSISPCPVVG